MTFLDIKNIQFDIKITNCKKYAKTNARKHWAGKLNFWKKLAGMCAMHRIIRFSVDEMVVDGRLLCIPLT